MRVTSKYFLVSDECLRLDVGGTSTDVSRFDGRYEVVYETTTAGVTIQSPQRLGVGLVLPSATDSFWQDLTAQAPIPVLHAIGGSSTLI